MKEVELIRVSKTDKAIYGILIVTDGNIVDYVCKTIENAAKSFPAGKYPIKLEFSPRFKTMLWELCGISERSEIKIHAANYYQELDGCIGVGQSHQDIDGDGDIDISISKAALNEFMIAMIQEKASFITVREIA